MATEYTRKFEREGEKSRDRGDEFLDDFQQEATSFDPYSAARRSSRAQFNTFREDLEEAIGSLRGQQVGMGRLNTGFATEGTDRLVSGALENLNNQIARRSLQASRQNLSRIGMLGNAGARAKNRYLDILAGNRDAKIARKNQELREKMGYIEAGTNLVTGLADAVIPF